MQNFDRSISNFNDTGTCAFITCPRAAVPGCPLYGPAKIPLTFINLNPLPTPFYPCIFAIGTNAIMQRFNIFNFEFQKDRQIIYTMKFIV